MECCTDSSANGLVEGGGFRVGSDRREDVSGPGGATEEPLQKTGTLPNGLEIERVREVSEVNEGTSKGVARSQRNSATYYVDVSLEHCTHGERTYGTWESEE